MMWIFVFTCQNFNSSWSPEFFYTKRKQYKVRPRSATSESAVEKMETQEECKELRPWPSRWHPSPLSAEVVVALDELAMGSHRNSVDLAAVDGLVVVAASLEAVPYSVAA